MLAGNLMSRQLILAFFFHLAARSDHSDADCFTCVLLSHGDFVHVVDKSVPDRLEKEDVVYSSDEILLISEIVEMFTDVKVPSLVGKPRLFFIQVSFSWEYRI